MKTIPKITIVSSMLLVSYSCFDKDEITPVQAETFMKYYNTFPVFQAADVKPVARGYVLLGTVENDLGSTQICLIRTDEFGNSIDSARYYGNGVGARAYCLQVLPDGGYAILGSARNPVTTKYEVLFIRTDGLGNPVWTRRIAGQGNVEAKHFEVSGVDLFIMTGYAERSSSVSEKQVWIGALDMNGNSPFWSPKMYGADRDDEGRFLQVLDDGGIVITGITKNDPENPGVNRAFFMKATSTGGATGFYYLPTDGEEEGNCIRILDEENFLIIGTHRSLTTTAGSDIMLKKVSMENFVYTTVWEKIFDEIPGNDTGQSLIAEDNSIFLLGTNATTINNTAIAFIVTDSEGQNPKYSYLGTGSQLSGISFERTSDNGFIISGTNKHTENSISAALIKIREDGSF